MALITRSFDFQSSQGAVADDVDTDLNKVYNEINGNIDNDNIKAAAGIVVTKLANTYRARAYRATSAQSISDATITKIQFNAESYDSNSNFDSATNYNYTAPVAGYYIVTAAMRFTSPADQQRNILYIYKNAAEYASVATQASGTSAQGCSITDIIPLSVGDTIDARVFHNTGAGQTVVATAAETFISIHLLSIS